MPRLDYSLSSIVALPKLSPIRSAPDTAVKSEHDTDLIIIKPHLQNINCGNINDDDNSDYDNDSDYDMLLDDSNVRTLIEPTRVALNPASGAAVATKSANSSAETHTGVRAAGDSVPTSPFVDMLLKDAEQKMDPNMTWTENGAPTYASSGDARLDFFFEVLKGTEMESIQALVRRSWEAYPLDTLRLIFQLRSILHGKGERTEFYVCMDFLRKEHPQTLLYNLRFIPDHGYWKDLLNWMVFETRETPCDYTLTSRQAKQTTVRPGTCRPNRRRSVSKVAGGERTDASVNSRKKDKKPRTEEERRRVIEDAEQRNRELSALARSERLEKSKVRLERAKAVFEENALYRALHLEVARLFANALARDKARMQQGRPISLVAKWCPSLNQLHDSHTLIASTIAQILFPDRLPEESQASYVNRVRQSLRREYYVPLRKATPVIETMMTARQWDEIEYNRVPAIAMQNNKAHFEAHDKERFAEYLESIAKGESTIAAQALKPHQLVTEATQLLDRDPDDLGVKTMEAQWKSYVDKLAQTGTMDSAMAICDVSGSMSGEPMEVAIALSLLLAQLCRPPFNQLVLTFSESPEVHRIPEGSLREKVESLRCMNWGMSTDLVKAFEHILALAVENRVVQEDMVKTLFVFSDMEFNQAVRGGNVGSGSVEAFPNYTVIKARYAQAGYRMPHVVFWKLRGSSRGNKPVTARQTGVSMVSGFSGILLKVFLDGEDFAKYDAVGLMLKTIEGREFSRLRVID
ncbi:hypothetical protein BGX28_008861 [Mortierella sp. GBA30]|nr:hypothetical protein BGX28_008861 [Mortierella sp. GBA30]